VLAWHRCVAWGFPFRVSWLVHLCAALIPIKALFRLLIILRVNSVRHAGTGDKQTSAWNPAHRDIQGPLRAPICATAWSMTTLQPTVKTHCKEDCSTRASGSQAPPPSDPHGRRPPGE
jgi:hypothetical protein